MKSMKAISILILFSSIVISLMLANISDAKIDSETIIAMWLFDDGDGAVVTDSSGNGYDGEIKGNASWDNGKFGGALGFDGVGAHVNAGVIPLPSDQVTACVWVYTDSAAGDWTHVLENGAVENLWLCSFRLELGPAEGQYYVAIGDAGAYADNDPNGVDIGWKYKEWQHLAFTFDGSVGRTYLNGNEVDSFGSDLSISAGAGTVIIGSLQGTQRYYNGLVDEIVIFDDVLGEADIKRVLKGMASVMAVSPAGKLAATWSSVKTQ